MKLLKIFILSFLIITEITLLFAKEVSLFSIDLYQKHISPHKGYRCAYSVWHNDISCSAYGKQVIAKEGLWRGVDILRKERFPLCRIAAAKIDSVRKQDGCSECPCDREKKGKKSAAKEECCCCCSWCNDLGKAMDETGEECVWKCEDSECGKTCGCDESWGGLEDFIDDVIPPGTN